MTNVTAITWASLQPALPEIYLTAAICVLLLVDVFAGQQRRWIAPSLTMVILALGALITAYFGNVNARILLFADSYVADPLAVLLKLFGFMIMAVALLYSREYLERRGMMRGEYYVLSLTSLLGIFVMVSANSLLTVYMGVELMSLSLYAMVAFDRDSGIAAESAMKYFVLGAIASGMLLYGMSLIYGLNGTLNLDDLAAKATGAPSLGMILGLVFVVVAIAFKFGAVPFHMWVPDVYSGAPTGVTLFLSTVPKIASFAFAFRLLAHGMGSVGAAWQDMLAPLAVLSMVFGNIIAIAQSSLKRLLAYSAVGNVGFILLGFVAGTAEGYEAALYYTVAYVIMTLGSFGVLTLASRAGFEAEDLDQFKGLHKRDPLLALVMMFMMFSTAGVPPFIGFWAKFNIFQALWLTGHWWLILIAAAMSVVGVFYYLRVVKLMYFDAPGDLPQGASSSMAVRSVLLLNGVAVFALGIAPNALIQLCARVIG
ncbi:MAG TPA: NADH-quinone oxidoreductase subunit NuoN [Steroidobacteraceae bacterium]|jgi:NADH-quinone oxidoreductase subunit N|nr:NADH-quinone oxidoreductase subunit NuoN [Steroidobacteraceae bacterium]